MATSYLGINMSGRTIAVVDSNGNSIGKLYHKERFTYSFELKTIKGKSHKKIWFRRPGGTASTYRNNPGYILNSEPIQNWMNYRFPSPTESFGACFLVDGSTTVYNKNKKPVATVKTPCYIAPANNAISGEEYKNLLGITAFGPRLGDSVLISRPPRGELYFVDTGVAENSSDTRVFGKWN